MEPINTTPTENTTVDCRGRVIHGSGEPWVDAILHDDGEGGFSIDGSYFNDTGETREEMEAILKAINARQSYRWDDIQDLVN